MLAVCNIDVNTWASQWCSPRTWDEIHGNYSWCAVWSSQFDPELLWEGVSTANSNHFMQAIVREGWGIMWGIFHEKCEHTLPRSMSAASPCSTWMHFRLKGTPGISQLKYDRHDSWRGGRLRRAGSEGSVMRTFARESTITLRVYRICVSGLKLSPYLNLCPEPDTVNPTIKSKTWTAAAQEKTSLLRW